MDYTLAYLAGFIISAIFFFTFINIARRLKTINLNIETLTKLELNKPENKKEATCPVCTKVYNVSILKQGRFNCTKDGCNGIIQL